jgi:two-component system, NarL family, invasion response regulator UvrY
MQAAKILVVDDHAIVREGVRGLFTVLCPSWTATEAADGAEAIQSIRRAPPDLVIMDITMPGSSGLQLLRSCGTQGSSRPS